MVATLQKTDEIISPTSILLGVSPEEIDRCVTAFDFQTEKITDRERTVYLDTDKIDFKFRIIDGQHRIKAFNKIFLENKLSELRNS